MTDYGFYNQILTRLAANHPGTLDEKTYELWKQDATSPHAFADPFAYLKTKGSKPADPAPRCPRNGTPAGSRSAAWRT